MIKYAVAPARRSSSEIRSLFSEILPDHQYVNYLNITPDYIINTLGSMIYYDKIKNVKKYNLIEYLRKFYSTNDLDKDQQDEVIKMINSTDIDSIGLGLRIFSKSNMIENFGLLEAIYTKYLNKNQYWLLKAGNRFPTINTLAGVDGTPLRVINLCFKYHC